MKPVITQKFNPKTVRGYDYFPDPYNRIGLISRTKGGKTTVIYRVLEETLPPKSKVTIFCPSVKTDKTYKKMIQMLKKKKCQVATYPHFMEDKHSILDDIVQNAEQSQPSLQNSKESEERPPIMEFLDTIPKMRQPRLDFGNSQQIAEKPKTKKKSQSTTKKSKKLAAEHVIIIDDLSSACREKSLTRLLCKARHLKLRMFVSLHSISNLHPDGIRQMSNLLLFPNINKDKICELVDKCGISFKNDTKSNPHLWNIYSHATRENYNFLNIDRQEMTFRRNFNELYKIDG